MPRLRVMCWQPVDPYGKLVLDKAKANDKTSTHRLQQSLQSVEKSSLIAAGTASKFLPYLKIFRRYTVVSSDPSGCSMLTRNNSMWKKEIWPHTTLTRNLPPSSYPWKTISHTSILYGALHSLPSTIRQLRRWPDSINFLKLTLSHHSCLSPTKSLLIPALRLPHSPRGQEKALRRETIPRLRKISSSQLNPLIYSQAPRKRDEND